MKINFPLALDSDLPIEKIYLLDDFRDAFSNVQAAVGISQLEKIRDNIAKRQEIAKIYNSNLRNVENIILPQFNPDSSFAHYTIRVENRRLFEVFMIKKGIQINKVFDYSLPHLTQFAKYVKTGEKFSNSLIAAKENVNLPNYPSLLSHKNKIDYITKIIREYTKTQHS